MEFFVILFTFIIVISAMGMHFDLRKQKLKMMAQTQSADQDALLKELGAIKQRLSVLERIVTDKGYSLQDEFSRLAR